MLFEYNNEKSDANRIKHGIDFEEAQALWEDEDRIEVPVNHISERRMVVIGMIQEKHWSAVITMRKGKTRIISVRRARGKEVYAYESGRI